MRSAKTSLRTGLTYLCTPSTSSYPFVEQPLLIPPRPHRKERGAPNWKGVQRIIHAGKPANAAKHPTTVYWSLSLWLSHYPLHRNNKLTDLRLPLPPTYVGVTHILRTIQPRVANHDPARTTLTLLLVAECYPFKNVPSAYKFAPFVFWAQFGRIPINAGACSDPPCPSVHRLRSTVSEELADGYQNATPAFPAAFLFGGLIPFSSTYTKIHTFISWS